MSKILKSRNLFLEKEELVRWDRFYQEDGIKSFIKNMLVSGGIVPDINGDLDNNFLFEEGSTHLKIKLSQDSIAYDSQGNRIFFKNQTGYEWSVPFNAGTTKDTWVWIQYGTTHIEEGTVSLAINGALTGVGTKFTELFRGQSTMVPNKIKIYARTPSVGASSGYTYGLQGTYEVNEVVTDTTLYLNTFNALPAGTYVFSVAGAFSPGSYDDSREEEVYEYDFVDVQFSDTLPTLVADQYLICKVAVNDGTSSQMIVDLRADKFILKAKSVVTIEKVINIGVWDMETNDSILIYLEPLIAGINFNKILSVEASIIQDDGIFISPLSRGGIVFWGNIPNVTGSNQVVLSRTGGGYFDSADYNSAVMNRGKLLIKYLP